jgi:hypothetical protein
MLFIGRGLPALVGGEMARLFVLAALLLAMLAAAAFAG